MKGASVISANVKALPAQNLPLIPFANPRSPSYSSVRRVLMCHALKGLDGPCFAESCLSVSCACIRRKKAGTMACSPLSTSTSLIRDKAPC